MNRYIQPNRAFYWRIQYEVPPCRGIFTVTSDDKLVESDLREWIQAKHPDWKIHKLTPIT